jgi:hypothetical protein
MARLNDPDRVCVVQRNPFTGCIPAATEWILRYHGAEGINFDSFQEDFDRFVLRGENNNFETVKGDVAGAHPHVELEVERFPKGDGAQKVARMEQLMAEDKACVLPLFVPNGFHAVPVIEVDERIVRVRWMNHAANRDQTVTLPRAFVVNAHDKKNGGHELLVVKSVSRPPQEPEGKERGKSGPLMRP